jgi:hypothetical protein
MRSFLEQPSDKGDNIKGLGMASYKKNRRNIVEGPLPVSLGVELTRYMRANNMDPHKYRFGVHTAMDVTAIVKLNGRR